MSFIDEFFEWVDKKEETWPKRFVKLLMRFVLGLFGLIILMLLLTYSGDWGLMLIVALAVIVPLTLIMFAFMWAIVKINKRRQKG